MQQDIKDLPAAIAANQVDGTPEQLAAAQKVQGMIAATVVSKSAAVQTGAGDAALVKGNAAAAAPAAAATPATSNNGNKKGNKNKGNN